MKTSELLELMEQAGQSGGSALNMRSEELQKKQATNRIKSLKKDLKKKSKILLALDVAIPFNPATGEEDDKFNHSTKYRPPVSATSAALIIKDFANKVPKTKEVLMKRAGVTEWDTSDSNTFTDIDRKVLLKYRVPRLFTINVVSVNIPAITKDMSREYSISVDRDPNTGDIVGKWPIALQINKLFRDTLYEEIRDYDEKVASGEFKHTDQQQSDHKREIYTKNPVSDDHPANWVELIEIPLNNKYSISADFDIDALVPEDIKGRQVVSRYSKKIRMIVESYMNGDLEKFDKYFDYFEMDMNCPLEGDPDTKSGKMQIGLDTNFEKPSDRLCDLPDFEKVDSCIRDFLDSDIDVERAVLRSVYVRPYNDDLERQLISSLKTVYSLDNQFCTDSVIRSNADIISLAFGDEGMNLLEEVDAGVTNKSNGNLDEDDSVKMAKIYDLSALDLDNDSIDLEEVTLQ